MTIRQNVETQVARPVAQVTDRPESSGGTLLEAPVLDGEGGLWLVDVRGPAGEGKLLRLELDSGTTTSLFTDDSGAYTSVQQSPADGRLYLTDFLGGRVVSVDRDGSDPQVFFEGPVDGIAMSPDDIAFDDDGNMYISDSHGMSAPHWASSGRVVRLDHATAAATVVADRLPAPNGISFDLARTGLWVSMYNANRIDHIGLDADGRMTSAHVAITLNGGHGRVDSNAVDGNGNIYQAWEGKAQLDVFAPDGDHLVRIVLPDDAPELTLATNMAIEPGGRRAYMTVSGPAGGFIYSFDALGDGIRQSNGG